jgi:hypothetical protein
MIRSRSLEGKDLYLIMARDSMYEGSWEKMLENLRAKAQDRHTQRLIRADATTATIDRIERLQQYEQEDSINLADYCLV